MCALDMRRGGTPPQDIPTWIAAIANRRTVQCRRLLAQVGRARLARRQAIAILRSCRAAMKPSSKILMVERVITGPPYLLSSVMSDLNMLVGPGGRERTEGEYAQLLTEAGLQLSHAIPSDSGFWIVEAKPIRHGGSGGQDSRQVRRSRWT